MGKVQFATIYCTECAVTTLPGRDNQCLWCDTKIPEFNWNSRGRKKRPTGSAIHKYVSERTQLRREKVVAALSVPTVELVDRA